MRLGKKFAVGLFSEFVFSFISRGRILGGYRRVTLFLFQVTRTI